MTNLRTIAIASTFVLVATTTAFAAVVVPQVPTPANPHPEFPIATDGTPLPPMGWAADVPTGGAMMPYADAY